MLKQIMLNSVYSFELFLKFTNKVPLILSVEQHYSGNKQRNAQVREDFPRAKDEQLREEIEARLKYQQLISQQ